MMERTKIGTSLYNMTVKWGEFLNKHMWLYYLLNYTWGIIMTLVGWAIIFFTHLFLSKNIVESGKFGPCHYVMIGDNWGGLELGVNFLIADKMGESWTLHTKMHESGHTFQNALFGPFAIILIFIPSAIRYWYQRIRTKMGKDNKPYDSIWFEGSATTVGENHYYYNVIK